MGGYYLGIDNGGTLCKAVLFNDKGKLCSQAQHKTDLKTPSSGFTQRSMEDIRQANFQCIRECIKDINPADIRCICTTGHGKGLYMVGEGGKLVYDGVVSTDTRAKEYIRLWQADGTAGKAYEKTFQDIMACHPAALLRWFKDNEPEVLKNVRHIFSVKDYVRYLLTGEAFAEMTDISGSSLLNLTTRDYDDELLALFGIVEVRSKLPPVKLATDICGRVTEEAAAETGLLEGTPVAGGMFDIDACAIAMNVVSEDTICVIAGTWSINEYISKTPVTDHQVMMNSVFLLPEYYLIEESSPTSAGNNEWVIDRFFEHEKNLAASLSKSVYELLNEMAESSEPDASLIFLPFLYGSNYNPFAKACFIGLDSSHEKKDIVRAVYESIVFSHRTHIEKLLAASQNLKKIRLAGGVAKSPVWVQTFADIIGLPIETVDVPELGAFGCAICASAACGQFPTVAEAAAAWVKIDRLYLPNHDMKEFYDKKFARYTNISNSLEKFWE